MMKKCKIIMILLITSASVYSNTEVIIKVPDNYAYKVSLDSKSESDINLTKSKNEYKASIKALETHRINLDYKDSTKFYSFYAEPDAIHILYLTESGGDMRIDRSKQLKGMYFRYVRSQIKSGAIYIGNLFIWPIAYWRRDKVRDKGKGFLWKFLNNKLGDNYTITNEPNDYGDEYFYNKYHKNDSKWSMFWLGYRWNTRNPYQNGYYSNIIVGEQQELWYDVYRNVPHGVSNWCTFYYTKNGKFNGKFGDSLDLEKSIFGNQLYVFTINGVPYFRKSYAKVIIKDNYLKLKCDKRGFENIGYAFQRRRAKLEYNDSILNAYKNVEFIHHIKNK